MDVLLLTERPRGGPGRWLWPLLMAAGLALLLAAGVASYKRHAGAHMGPGTRAQGPSGLVVPSPNDPGWTEYYRNARAGVSMAVHLPALRRGDLVVVWQKYVEQPRSVLALAEIHYDCRQHTRHSARMAVYRNGSLDGVADMPGASVAVPVEENSVEQDALTLVCSGKMPESIDDEG